MDMLVALIIAAMVAAYFGWPTPKVDGKTIISVVGTIPAAYPRSTSRKSISRGVPSVRQCHGGTN
ncbi:MAG: hypothetical protein JO279_07675 [Verrucomicrobia bacterium]|nr:hypothetical protein [Verrucomicrobiota bacterium]